MVQAFRAYEASVISTARRKNQLRFLRDCLEEQVLPSSISHIHRHSDEGSPFPEYARSLLLDRISAGKRDVEHTFYLSRLHFDFLGDRLPRQVCRHMADVAHDSARVLSNTHTCSLTRKLSTLTSCSPWSRFSLTDAITNLSFLTLTPHQLQLLGFGLSFALRPLPLTSIDIISSFDRFISGHRNSLPDVSLLRGAFIPALESLLRPKPSIPRRYQEALQSLRREDVTILPSDKGNSVVVLDQASYLQKAQDLLDDVATYAPLTSNPRERIAATFHRRLKQLASGCPEANLYQRFRVINPRLPHFYGLPKTHKPDVPLRPIISSRGSVAHPLASWLAQSLTPLLGTFSPAHLRHSQDFIARVRGVTSSTMMSLDVESLFTNVPLDDVLAFLQRNLLPEDPRLPLPTAVFLQLIRLCVDSNSFSFERRFYSQTFGVAMGSPLSPVLANLFMEYFEAELLPSISLRPAIWLRYVDDVFALWPHDPALFPDFLDKLNSLSPSIRFKVEWEVGDQLPFLDTLIHRSGDSFSFSVYRKPMHSGTYIHFFSYHPLHVKRGVATSLFLRALRICDPQHLDEEIDFLRRSFGKLGYPRFVLDAALSNARRTFYQDPPPRETSHLPVISLPYTEEIHSLRRSLHPLNCRLTFRQVNTLRRNLVHTRPPSSAKIGTYAIPCSSCEKQYFGETGACLNKRVSQHKYAVSRGHTNNALFCHQWDTGHRIDWSAAHILFPSADVHARRLVESSLINRLPNFNLNRVFSSADGLLSSHILRLLPYPGHPSHRPPDPMT
uniref:Putative reverse transcriptase n=1 Tax=Penaeus japonicus TaxID=27405 RepID=I7HI75_PENJP|nr:putative reverse transcriptase [Penaeus japonicus]